MQDKLKAQVALTAVDFVVGDLRLVVAQILCFFCVLVPRFVI